MRNDWRNIPDDDSSPMIEALRDDLRDAARLIRHCDCDQGYIITEKVVGGHRYECSTPCHCIIAWKNKGRELLNAVRDWEKRQGYEYRDLITPEMTYHAHPTEAPATRETIERARRAITGIDFDLPVEETA